MDKNNSKQTSYLFLRSAFASEGSFLPTSEVIKWLDKQNQEVHVNINRTQFEKLAQWSFDHESLRHQSGKFLVLMAFG